MYRAVYTFILYLALPFILLRLWLKSFAVPGYRRRIGERFGWGVDERRGTDKGDDRPLWIHAVSVGEAAATEPLLGEVRKRYPRRRVHITTMTPTGSDRVRQIIGGGDKSGKTGNDSDSESSGSPVTHSYLPYDYPGAVRRFFDRLQPAALILMETELWPNLIHIAHRRGVKILLANARLSARSARRYGLLPGATAGLLRRLDAVAVQSEADAARFRALGADHERVHVTGSLKFNVQLESVDLQADSLFAAIHAASGSRPVVLAASTREGEEGKVLAAFRRVLSDVPDCLLLLVPRHPQRFDVVADLLAREGLGFVRRSADDRLSSATHVVLGDSMGEMAAYIELAHVAFVGGSLVDTGCQNVLEPAARGVPVVVGPSQYNFAEICRVLEDCGALNTVVDVDGLARALIDLLKDPQRRRRQGEAGRALVAANQQALHKLMEVLEGIIRPG